MHALVLQSALLPTSFEIKANHSLNGRIKIELIQSPYAKRYDVTAKYKYDH